MGRELVHENDRYAVRETVSDEEILTPWFATKEELIEHLVKHGDSWGSGPVNRENAECFVKMKFVPSGMLFNGRMLTTYQCAFK